MLVRPVASLQNVLKFGQVSTREPLAGSRPHGRGGRCRCDHPAFVHPTAGSCSEELGLGLGEFWEAELHHEAVVMAGGLCFPTIYFEDWHLILQMSLGKHGFHSSGTAKTNFEPEMYKITSIKAVNSHSLHGATITLDSRLSKIEITEQTNFKESTPIAAKKQLWDFKGING